MSGNAGTLAVSLHVNSASFKADLMDAYQTGSREARRFAESTRREMKETGDAIGSVGTSAGGLGRTFEGLSSRLKTGSGGFDQLRSALNGFAATGNVSASTLANALVPAISRTLTGAEQLKGVLAQQRDAFSKTAQAAYDAARAQIQSAQAAKQKALDVAQSAAKDYEAAKAVEENAVALARHYDQQQKVNKEYGLAVSYREEYRKINAQLKESDMAASVAKQRVAAAGKAAAEAEALEALGKSKLSDAMRLISARNYEISLSARAAAAGTALLNGALAMVGGPVGLGIIALVSGVTALWSAYSKAEEKTKALNAALLQGNSGASLSLTRIRALNKSLGDTDGSMKAVTAAVKAGFSGEMLDRVSSLGSQLESLGGNADELVRQLSSISGDPIKAMQDATQQGYEFNAAQIEQIATLARLGKTAEAVALVQKIMLDDVADKMKEQQRQTEESIGWWEKLKKAVSEGLEGYASAQIETSRAMAAAVGVDIDEPARKLKEKRDEEKKQEEDRAQAARQRQDEQSKEITARINLAAWIKAGTDKTRLAAEATADLSTRYKAGKITADEYASALRGIDKLYGDKKTGVSAHQDSEGVRRLAQLKQQEVVLKAQGRETERMGESQKKLLAFEQEIASYAGKKLTKAQESVLAMQDQLRAQLETNAALEKQNAQRNLAVTLEKQLRDVREETARRQQEQNNAAAQVTMSDREYEQMVTLQQIREDFAQKQKALDEEVKDHSSVLYQAQTQALAEEMQRQTEIVKKGAEDKKAAEEDFAGAAAAGMKNWMDKAGNYAQQIKDAVSSAMDGLADNIVATLNGNKSSWRDWGTMILQTIQKILVNAALVNGLKALGGSLGGAGGILGGIGSAISGVVGNARGGVYDSPGLSAYSSTVVDRPTLFPFAKGAGLMGEAGPEAIMPLTRDSKGRLAVTATGMEGTGGSVVVNQQFSVHIQNDGSNGEIGPGALKMVYEIAEQAAMKTLTVQGRDGGRLSGAYR